VETSCSTLSGSGTSPQENELRRFIASAPLLKKPKLCSAAHLRLRQVAASGGHAHNNVFLRAVAPQHSLRWLGREGVF
jgi:hypothetical protein